MEKIGLVETIDALRSELAAAVEKAQGQEIQFPIGSVQGPTLRKEPRSRKVDKCGAVLERVMPLERCT